MFFLYVQSMIPQCLMNYSPKGQHVAASFKQSVQ